MIDARFVPVDKWPAAQRKSWQRKRAPFGASYARTLIDLERELKQLGARNIAIQSYFRPQDIRNDGWPRSSAPNPSDPGIIVSFTDRHGKELSFPCDTFTSWQMNLRAIALSLAALRAVDRYGVTQHNEQYKGWAKLPPASDRMDVKDALAFISLYTGISPTSAEALNDAYRMAARKLHPDATSGGQEQFILLGRAKKAIEESYGWR